MTEIAAPKIASVVLAKEMEIEDSCVCERQTLPLDHVSILSLLSSTYIR